ncbi:MAG: prepilin-type N-terminal cleavage/methylation domain-containing protein [Okeania sp. SIO1H6]|nr:prepilin-type N-terminal cleavage/methylation domain-containing protein [Okeania sp. SIO1H6]
MKTEFKAKFLQHVAKKRKEEGFTLIELLVVIIIIGILSAIALPSFLNQANKAKQSEAKQYTASINKGQQAYYAENSKFVVPGGDGSAAISELGLGLRTQTANYKYEIISAAGGDDTQGMASAAAPATPALAGYVGVVGLVGTGEAKTTTTTICSETGLAAWTNPAAPTADGTVDPTCGANQEVVNN